MNDPAAANNADNLFSDDFNEAGKPRPLAKIEPVKVAAADVANAEQIVAPKNDQSLKETSLVEATRNLLKFHGIRKSAAAVREAVEMPHEVFSPKEAVSALSSLGF